MREILPTVIMCESFAAGFVYLLCGEWGRAVYWIAAGLLNLAVVYLI